MKESGEMFKLKAGCSVITGLGTKKKKRQTWSSNTPLSTSWACGEGRKITPIVHCRGTVFGSY
jgi:hypothetical protein